MCTNLFGVCFGLQARDSSDFQRVSAEVRQLRDGESQLRQENMQLKVSSTVQYDLLWRSAY